MVQRLNLLAPNAGGQCLIPSKGTRSHKPQLKILHAAMKPINEGDTKDVGLIPGLGRSPGEGKGNPLQCSCLENSMNRGAWWATTYGVAKSWAQLSRDTHTHF